MIIIFLLAVFIAAGLQQNAYAATKKVKMIDDKNITYYKSGLVKKVNYYGTVGVYKYDKKGRITEIREYQDHSKEENLITVLSLKYTGKGKLKSIVKKDFEDGELLQKKKCKFSLTKEGRIKLLKCTTRYSGDFARFSWAYDSKGRVSKAVYKSYTDGEVDVLNKYTITRTKGAVRKIVGSFSNYGDESGYTATYKYQKKSGKVKKIIRALSNSSKGYQEIYKISYESRKVDKGLWSVIKTQQKDMMYLFAAPEGVSPMFFLIAMI